MLKIIFEDRIPKHRREFFEVEAIRALRIYKQQQEEKNKKLYSLECAIGSLHGCFVGPYVVARWTFKKPTIIKVVVYE